MEAETLTQDAIDRSSRAAAKECPGWEEEVIQYFQGYYCSGHHFTCEELRNEVKRNWITVPREARAFGKVIQRLHKNDKIRAKGWRSTSNPKAHKRPVRVWEVL